MELVNGELEKKWEIAAKPSNVLIDSLSQMLNVSSIISTLLVHREIDTYSKAKTFFRPNLDELHDPYLMKDMEKAIHIIHESMGNNESILIYGDYDVDGTTSVALLYSYLGIHYHKLGYYIPDRNKEGYGVSSVAIDFAEENNYKLIITLDCGITANEEVDYAASKGIKVIISDHHLPKKELPKAAAILNPKQEGCNYPYKDLSGCGIGFKIAQAFCTYLKAPVEDLYQVLDLVAVSIASDLVAIDGENRVLAYFGLKKLNTKPLPGLKALKDQIKKTSTLSISDIVFYIGPRINAAGRLGDAKDAVRLLLTTDSSTANMEATKVNGTNLERKQIDSQITEEAMNMVLENVEYSDIKSTVVYHESWNKGVIGIVASRLIDKFYRPTIVFTKSEGFLTGSARSVKNFNIHSAISQCSEFVEQFGGHMYAAGLSIKEENFLPFKQKFEEVVSQSILEEQLYPTVEIDVELQFSEITSSFMKVLNQFSPYGPGNMDPVFLTKKVHVLGARIVGVNHLILKLKQHNSNFFEAVAFNKAQYYKEILHQEIDICYTIEDSITRGHTYQKFIIKDFRLSK